MLKHFKLLDFSECVMGHMHIRLERERELADKHL